MTSTATCRRSARVILCKAIPSQEDNSAPPCVYMLYHIQAVARVARLVINSLGRRKFGGRCSKSAQKISSTSSRRNRSAGHCGKPQIFAQTSSAWARAGEGARSERDVGTPGSMATIEDESWGSQGSRRPMSRAWRPLPPHWRIAAGKGVGTSRSVPSSK
jgi:hypothetical protein